MRGKASTVGVLMIALGISAAAALSGQLGDYTEDAGPTIRALLDGDFAEALSKQPMMGSFSILLRVPFAALSYLGDGSELLVYRLGALPCLFAAALLGAYLIRLMAERGQPVGARAAVGGLCALNPMTLAALQYGHPEEMLGGALCVIAVIVAGRGRPLAAGLLLGLALATKQWAVLAVLPALIAAPVGRLRLTIAAGAVAAALTLPLAVGDPESFATTARNAANTYSVVSPANVWWPFASSVEQPVFDGVEHTTVTVYATADWVSRLSHPLIVLAALPLSLLLWRRRRHAQSQAHAAIGLLALLFLLRTVLDPVNAGYYHVPFLLSLAAYEGLGSRPRLPLLTISSAAALWVIFDRIAPMGEPALWSAAYLSWGLPLAAGLALSLYAPSVISDLGKRLRISQPSSVTATRSSIRTPNAPAT